MLRRERRNGRDLRLARRLHRHWESRALRGSARGDDEPLEIAGRANGEPARRFARLHTICMRHTLRSKGQPASFDTNRLLVTNKEAHLTFKYVPSFVVCSVKVERRHIARRTGKLNDRHKPTAFFLREDHVHQVGEKPAGSRDYICHPRSTPTLNGRRPQRLDELSRTWGGNRPLG